MRHYTCPLDHFPLIYRLFRKPVLSWIESWNLTQTKTFKSYTQLGGNTRESWHSLPIGWETKTCNGFLPSRIEGNPKAGPAASSVSCLFCPLSRELYRKCLTSFPSGIRKVVEPAGMTKTTASFL